MKKYLFTSESVTEGHPDKLCDYISDTILDECLKQDPLSRVAVESFASKNKITVAGQLTTNAKLNFDKIVREVLKSVGYDNENADIDYRTCEVDVNITQQSTDIAQGVNIGGAGDQGMMFGYACNETDEYMPFAISMAHKLAKRLEEVRKEGIIEYIRADGKTQVTVEYEDDIPVRIDTILLSTQHLPDIKIEKLKEDIIKFVINEVIDLKYIDSNTKIYVNPTGRFVIGGPLGDTGLTGRKIIVDTYGGYSRHGGGAFSGKDATKVDRSAAYMMRHIAKNIVANELASKCEIEIAYAIGMREPLSLYVNTFGTSKFSDDELIKIIYKNFDLTPDGIIQYLDLRKPIYTKTTNYGHFGAKDLPWEKQVELKI